MRAVAVFAPIAILSFPVAFVRVLYPKAVFLVPVVIISRLWYHRAVF